MKQELKRIEAALHQLADRHSQGYAGSVPQRDTLAQVMSGVADDRATANSSVRADASLPAPSSQPQLSTKVEVLAKVSLPTFPTSERSEAHQDQLESASPAQSAQQEVLIQPFSISLSETKAPDLPRLKAPNFTTHRNAANPALTMNLLKEMEAIVISWQEELQQVLRQIQDLYLEGPIVDGWLESYAHQEGEAPAFRHADVDCLMDYVEKMRGSTPPEPISSPSSAETSQPGQDANSAGYRLCGLNEDGQLWFRHCPAEQVPSVSLAIARYQRLRVLLSRKQDLETRLSQLAETLIVVHSKLNA
jgi:hypothetical protein